MRTIASLYLLMFQMAFVANFLFCFFPLSEISGKITRRSFAFIGAGLLFSCLHVGSTIFAHMNCVNEWWADSTPCKCAPIFLGRLVTENSSCVTRVSCIFFRTFIGLIYGSILPINQHSKLVKHRIIAIQTHAVHVTNLRSTDKLISGI